MATLVFSTTACLDKYPDDMVPADKAITTVDEVDQAIIGIYASWLNGALYSGYLTLLPDIQADLAYAVNGYSNQFGNTWRWNILATEPEYESVYAGLYNVITRCNFMLDNVDRVRQNTTNDDDLDRLDQYCGEAYFARALAYSELIKLFCKAYDPATAANELGVVLKSHYDGDEPTIRSSLEASYQFVLDDLAKAYDYLEPDEGTTLVASDYYDSPYFNEFTVQALMARIYLYMQDWDNAIKYSGAEQSYVKVTLSEDDRNIITSVSDKGMGICEEDQAHVFERFFRADKARNREIGGTGLGLSIIANIAQIYHGSVSVKSKLGEGSTFTLVLPKAESLYNL